MKPAFSAKSLLTADATACPRRLDTSGIVVSPLREHLSVMTVSLRSMLAISAVTLLCASIAGAQSNPSPASSQQPASAAASDEASRPATTTFYGDTGLWYVPTGEVLAKGRWSGSVYRRGTNWVQGYTNVADFAGTFAVGVRVWINKAGTNYLVNMPLAR